jgi:hypothetical protein
LFLSPNAKYRTWLALLEQIYSKFGFIVGMICIGTRGCKFSPLSVKIGALSEIIGNAIEM